jgi:sulfonate transport system substrate-binding protein
MSRSFALAGPLIGGNQVAHAGFDRILVPASSSSLKGKSVATNRGLIGHFLMLKALASVGLKAEDINLRFLSPLPTPNSH